MTSSRQSWESTSARQAGPSKREVRPSRPICGFTLHGRCREQSCMGAPYLIISACISRYPAISRHIPPYPAADTAKRIGQTRDMPVLPGGRPESQTRTYRQAHTSDCLSKTARGAQLLSSVSPLDLKHCCSSVSSSAHTAHTERYTSTPTPRPTIIPRPGRELSHSVNTFTFTSLPWPRAGQ